MTLALLLRIFWVRRLFIMLSTLGCGAVAAAVAAMLPSQYLASARVELEIVRANAVSGSAISSEYARAYVATQAELIKDYSVTGRAVDAAGLQSSPQLAAQYQASGASGRMDFRRWLADMLSSNTSVTLVQDSNILAIHYAAATPELAANLAELIRAAYIDETLAAERARAAQTAEWFEERRLELGQRLAAARTAKTEFERENGVVMVSDEVTASEQRLRAWSISAPSRSTIQLPPPAEAPSGQALAEIRQRIAAASQTLGPNHPTLIALRQQEQALEEAAARERAAAQPQAAPADTAGVDLERQQRQVIAEGEIAGELRRLAANITLLQQQYAEAAQRVADAEMQAASVDIGFTPVGPATGSSKPAFPNYGLVIALSLGFGLILGTLTALFLELLSLRIRHADDLEALGSQVLNAAPAPSRDPGAAKDDPAPASPTAEPRRYSPAPAS